MGAQPDEGMTLDKGTARAAEDGLYRQLFEASAEALVVVDAQGRIALLNARAEALFGYRPGKAEAESCRSDRTKRATSRECVVGFAIS